MKSCFDFIGFLWFSLFVGESMSVFLQVLWVTLKGTYYSAVQRRVHVDKRKQDKEQTERERERHKKSKRNRRKNKEIHKRK